MCELFGGHLAQVDQLRELLDDNFLFVQFFHLIVPDWQPCRELLPAGECSQNGTPPITLGVCHNEMQLQGIPGEGHLHSANDIESSAQRVPEADPLPGISFDTWPDPIQFWKSSGSG